PHRIVDDALLEPLDAELLRESREELVERVVRDRAAQLRIHLRVDRARREMALDEPGRGAVGEALELRDVEGRLRLELLEHEWMRHPRRALERSERALEPPLPRVRTRESRRSAGVPRCEPGERAQPLALGGRVVDRPRERGERPPPGPAAHVVRIEQRLHLLPERAGLARRAVVRCRLPHEVEPVEGARARGVEEVAVAAHRIGPLEARAALVEQTARVVVEERRRRAAARQAPLLEPEHEDDVEASRARAREVEHGDAPGLVAAERPERVTIEHRDDVLPRELARQRAPALELGEDTRHVLVRAQVEARRLADRRLLEPVRVAQHPRGEGAHRPDGVVGAPQLRNRRKRATVQFLALDDDTLGRPNGAPPQPPLDEVDRAALDARERRAQEREELATPAVEPRETQQREQRMPERRLRDAHLAVDRVRHAERAERRLERRAQAVDARTDDADALGRGPRAQQLEQLLADELERTARTSTLEEAHRTVERDRLALHVGEERPLEPGERGLRGPQRAELLDRTAREALQILRRPPERLERRPPGLVGQRDAHLRAPGERLEQRPLRTGQILEAVGEDRLSVPGVELRAQPVGGAAAQEVAVAEPQLVELRAIRAVERGEVAVQVLRVEQTRLELADRADELLDEAGEARRGGEAAERRALHRPPRQEDALGRRDDGPRARDPLEEIVE